jgi:hypothetical protein
MALLLKHQTAEAFIQRVRAAYRGGNPETIIKIARFIIARIQAGDITDAQCRTAFGLNTTQWNALKTKMQNLITAANAVESAVGE